MKNLKIFLSYCTKDLKEILRGGKCLYLNQEGTYLTQYHCKIVTKSALVRVLLVWETV